MGITNTKSSLRNAIIHLNISADEVSIHDEKFWSQIWQEEISVAAEVIKNISTQETRMLRDGSPKNFAKLAYKMVERLSLATGTLCNTSSQQTAVLNAARILIRIIPCIFEDRAWRNFFILNNIQQANELRQEPQLIYPEKQDKDRNYESYLPAKLKSSESNGEQDHDDAGEEDNNYYQSAQIDLLGGIQQEVSESLSNQPTPTTISAISNESLMKVLILSTCDLLFCPEFTVLPHSYSYHSTVVDAPPEDLKSLATCDYVWEPGVGFDSSVNSTTYYDKSRADLLRLLLTCLSSTLYETAESSIRKRNQWIELFASKHNRHALPLFTSLLNTVFTYKPSKLLPFNRILFEDGREELVELSLQLLIATLDHNFEDQEQSNNQDSNGDNSNLFIEYMSRIHRSEDFMFIIKGTKRLLNIRLDYTYLLGTAKQINFDQELLVLFWKFCNFNKKFMVYLLKTDDVIDIVVPTLYHLSENFQDPSKTALIHIGVFNLLILSGERNFGVKLNKSYDVSSIPNIPTFVGSHADLMIIVFHKLILYGLNLNQLYDFMLTIIVNISPYLKTLSSLACRCLIQLFEIFSSPFVLFTEPNYHQLVIFLLEVFNNLVQYQFDGNATLVYVLINKKDGFINLANLPVTSNGIEKVLSKLVKKKKRQMMLEKLADNTEDDQSSESSSLQSKSSSSHPRQNTNNSGQFTQVGATVSSVNTQSKMPSSQQREVFLVATPDICNVTQAIHPFDNIESLLSPNQPRPTEEPSINFDESVDQQSKMAPELRDNEDFKVPMNGSSMNERPNEDLNEDSSQTREKIEEFGLNIGNNIEGVGATKKWRPTPEWVKQYKSSLPLQSILRMIEVLAPQVEQFRQNDNSNQLDETTTIRFLQNSTLVGLLPVPHPILIRKYRTNHQTALWFRACTWGMIFVRNTIWTDTNVRLIKVV